MPLPANTKSKTGKPAVRQQIDADTWAESGGTIGIFGKLHRAGKLEIVETPEDGERILPTGY